MSFMFEVKTEMTMWIIISSSSSLTSSSMTNLHFRYLQVILDRLSCLTVKISAWYSNSLTSDHEFCVPTFIFLLLTCDLDFYILTSHI